MIHTDPCFYNIIPPQEEWVAVHIACEMTARCHRTHQMPVIYVDTSSNQYLQSTRLIPMVSSGRDKDFVSDGTWCSSELAAHVSKKTWKHWPRSDSSLLREGNKEKSRDSQVETHHDEVDALIVRRHYTTAVTTDQYGSPSSGSLGALTAEHHKTQGFIKQS